jgi:two-component system osmolarity sensor histidine kinase EnvZ
VLKRLMPKTLLGRTLLIIVSPVVLLQVALGVIFFEGHWDKVSMRLARNLAGDIAAVVSLMQQYPGEANRDWIFTLAGVHMEINGSFSPDAILHPTPPGARDRGDETLARALEDYVGKPFRIDAESLDRHVAVDIQLSDGVLTVATTRKRVFSSTTYVFVLWMVGTSLIVIGIATVFMRNQVKSIRRLAHAADAFGKGRDVAGFKPEGAREVRQAASAFLAMRDRIQRQIAQRTEMLAGVSHDLRTPLTRMKLELAMLGDGDGVADLQRDVAEMERMLEGYLAFARGEGGEKPVPTDLGALLAEVTEKARRKGGAVDLHVEGEIETMLRPDAFRRCVTNLVENATRYAGHVSLRAGRRKDSVDIVIDDDGPGIPPERREDVFKPFFRLEGSRNPGTGGVGLGLSIARDIARGHGGDIELADSPTGGLRVRLRLPV